MARPVIANQQLRAYRLYSGRGFSAGAITSTLEQEFDEPVSKRTVERWIGKFKKLPSENTGLDQPFHWHLFEDYGIPWEASELILSLTRFILLEPVVDDFEFSQEGPITVRQVIWWWRVSRAVPELWEESTIPLYDLYSMAQRFVFREVERDVLQLPVDFSDLEAHLIYKPWIGGLDGDNHLFYEQAIRKGEISELTELSVSNVDAWVEAMIAGKLPDKGDSAFVPFPKYKELLTTQQHVLFNEEHEALRKRRANGEIISSEEYVQIFGYG